MSTHSSSGGSPKRPPLGLDNDGDTWTSKSAATLVEDGYRAIKEIERVLFFTDLKDDAERQQAARRGIVATEHLQRLLFVSSVDNMNMSGQESSPSSSGKKTIPNEELRLGEEKSPNTESLTPATQQQQNNASSSSSSLPMPSTALTACTAMEIMDMLKSHFESAWSEMEKVGHKAVKEAERKILFTDLDENKLAIEAKNSKGTSHEALKEIEVLLQDIEHKWASFAVQNGQPALESGFRAWKEMERSSQKAYKECERILLFTDLDESASSLAKDKSNNDLFEC